MKNTLREIVWWLTGMAVALWGGLCMLFTIMMAPVLVQALADYKVGKPAIYPWAYDILGIWITVTGLVLGGLAILLGMRLMMTPKSEDKSEDKLENEDGRYN